jgi:predicted aspartyl protease
VLIVEAQIGRFQVDPLANSGAALTALTSEAVDRLLLDRSRFTGRRIVGTAGGTSIAVPTGRVDSLRLRGIELRDVEVAILDLPPGMNVDGLLGVNVLDRFRATFEFRRSTLVLRREWTR